jgi:fructosamine-3-kinase
LIVPEEVREAIESALGTGIADARPLTGGDINKAARVVLQDNETIMLKWNRAAGPDFFAAEAHGLKTLAAASALRVPGVIAVGAGFLALEWIEKERRFLDRDAFGERFGRALADLHRHTADSHGLDRDNYIGTLPQSNAQGACWLAFYREERIGAQLHIARERGRLVREREEALLELMDHLSEWIDDSAIVPSLLHGDLWSGNFMIGVGGEPVLIDPAVYYGHREVDLAMTELFGGFPGSFYAAYNESYPLDGYEERRALYQLYPLMVHMNLFGGSYSARVDNIARYYLG